MTTATRSSGVSPLLRWALVVLLALITIAAAPRTAKAEPVARAAVPVVVAAAHVPGSPVASSWHWLAGNRSRMIQIATLGMILGLFILMRK